MARPVLTPEQRAQLEQRQRSQILRGMAERAAADGYLSVRIADIAKAARVSKSTFYAHFADKEECFVALYSITSDRTIGDMEAAHQAALTAELPWRDHVSAVNRAMLARFASDAALARSLVIDTQAAGPTALEIRRDVTERFAKLVRRVSDGLGRRHDELNRITPPLSLAIVGGNNELIMRALLAEKSLLSAAVRRPIDAMWCAVLTAPR